MEKKAVFKIADKKNAILLGAAFIGILLIIIAGISGEMFSSLSAKKDELSLDEYITQMEQRLCDTVCSINGAGKTKVFITAENSFETVYASNATLDESGDETKNTKTTQKELAYLTDGANGESPVVVKQICPRICGVLIVCEGGSDSKVRNEIINSVATAFGISSSKVYVTGGIQ